MTALASTAVGTYPLCAAVSADGRRLGRVDGFLVDANGQATHFVLMLELGQRGRRRVAVPLGAVTRIATGSVTLGLTIADVRGLPDVALGRRAVTAVATR